MGGQAKHRKAEIERLKQNSPEEAARWRQLQEDRRDLVAGVQPASQSPYPVMAFSRVMYAELVEAQHTGSIDATIATYQAVTDRSLENLSGLPLACKKGCAHCCYTQVSVTAPEVLALAKILKAGGGPVIERIRSAHEKTKDYDVPTRALHPIPCPLLEDDVCSVYEARPMSCRVAASTNAESCARAFHKITNEEVPMPKIHMIARTSFITAMAAGLRKAGLPRRAYELNAALHRAIHTEDAEQRWLKGEDIFQDVLSEPADMFSHEPAEKLYEQAFKEYPTTP